MPAWPRNRTFDAVGKPASNCNVSSLAPASSVTVPAPPAIVPAKRIVSLSAPVRSSTAPLPAPPKRIAPDSHIVVPTPLSWSPEKSDDNVTVEPFAA